MTNPFKALLYYAFKRGIIDGLTAPEKEPKRERKFVESEVVEK